MREVKNPPQQTYSCSTRIGCEHLFDLRGGHPQFGRAPKLGLRHRLKIALFPQLVLMLILGLELAPLGLPIPLVLRPLK